MTRWIRRSRDLDDQAGFALILVVGMSLVLMGLLLVGTTVTMHYDAVRGRYGSGNRTVTFQDRLRNVA